MIDREPEITADDTQPRAPLISELERAPAEPPPDEPRGCANPLLIVFVVLSLLILFVATVGLAGVAGYRDGVNDAATYAVRTRIAAIGTQRAHITIDLQSGNWESALARCQYVGTLQPGDPLIARCIDDSQRALSATPTTAASATSTPPPPTLAPTGQPTSAQPAATTAANSSPFSPEELWARAQEELRKENYETVVGLLEAVRGADANFNRQEIEAALCSSYETLGEKYAADKFRLSEMVIVIDKAQKMNCRLTRSDWGYTINVAQLYLDAKGYLDAGNYATAAAVYKKLLGLGSNFLDMNALACQAFSKAGDSAALKQYKC